MNVKPNEIIVEEYREMSESRISAGETEKLQGLEKLTQNRLRGPTTWKDMLKKCVERYCELANKKTEQ